MSDLEVPVLIVGGSLVGMSAALLLGSHGIRSLAVEHHRGTAIHPRAAQITQRTMEILQSKVKPAIGARGIVGDDKIAKVSLVGIGMRTHAGIAAKMFGALANEGVNIQMISTSEIKTSVVVDEKYMELAVRVLHKAFELDKEPTEEKMKP